MERRGESRVRKGGRATEGGREGGRVKYGKKGGK